MLRPFLFLFFFHLLATLTAQNSREFDALVLNQLAPGSNTTLLVYPQIGLRTIDDKTGEVVADLRVTVTVSDASTRAITREWTRDEHIRQGFDNNSDPFLLQYPLSLKPGRYIVEVELRDMRTQMVHYTSLSYEARDLLKGNALSDLSVAQGFAGAEMPLQPLLGTQLIPFPEAQLTFSGEAYAAPGSTLTLRAVLYQQSSPEPGEAAAYDYDKVETFSSVQQFNRILKTGPQGKVKFEETVPVDPLEEGEYLLEVALYAGETRVSETGRNFTIPWKGLREVFANLDDAVDRMSYIATPEVIADIREETNTGIRQEKFLRFWNTRAGVNGRGLDALRKYYERILYADAQFAEGDTPGWRTDRGRVYCLYGTPSRMETISWEGKPVEVWTYLPRNLRMVFLVEGDKYRWVEPYHQ